MTYFDGNDIHYKDIDTFEVWKKIGVSSNHLCPTKKNWKGPYSYEKICGPNTRIFYDTKKEKCSHECNVTCACGKYVELSDVDIFNLNILGFPNDLINIIIDYLKYLLKYKKIKSENTNKFLSKYEKLNFVEKIDVITEIIRRMDNETLIDDVWFPRLDSNLSGYDIALIIKEYKNNL